MLIPITLFSAALACGLIATCLVRKVAPKWGLLDQPDARRKLHHRAIPLGGGVAVLAAAGMALAVLYFFTGDEHIGPYAAPFLGLLLASLLIVSVGLVDDSLGLRGRQKLIGQVLAACILLKSGICIQEVEVFGFGMALGWLCVPFTIFWIVGAINAINLLDGIDGLASTVGVILVLAIAAMAAVVGRMEVALVALAFAGALLGFLRFNYPPASIFLGDAGSMLIGLVVGVLAIEASLKGAGTVLLSAPLAIWAIPILDSSAAILRRKLTGRSIYATDRAHFHHRLMHRLGSNRKTLAILGGCCLVTCLAALASVYFKNDLVAAITCLALLSMLIVTRTFGHVELALLTSKISKAGISIFTPTWRSQAPYRSAVHLQGQRSWELLLDTLVEWAEKMGVVQIDLNVSLPQAHEEFHTSWRNPSIYVDEDRTWRLALPLEMGSQTVGSLRVTGCSQGDCVQDNIEMLLDMLKPFQASLAHLAADEATEQAPEEAGCVFEQPARPAEPVAAR